MSNTKPRIGYDNQKYRLQKSPFKDIIPSYTEEGGDVITSLHYITFINVFESTPSSECVKKFVICIYFFVFFSEGNMYILPVQFSCNRKMAQMSLSLQLFITIASCLVILASLSMFCSSPTSPVRNQVPGMLSAQGWAKKQDS